MSEIRKMEEVTGTKERNQKNDIAVRTNGDQASCKRIRVTFYLKMLYNALLLYLQENKQSNEFLFRF